MQLCNPLVANNQTLSTAVEHKISEEASAAVIDVHAIVVGTCAPGHAEHHVLDRCGLVRGPMNGSESL